MAFASICEHARSVFILRARAVVKFFLRAASTLENTDGEQRALRVLRKFSASQNLSFINRINVLRQVIANNLADTSKTEQQLQAELLKKD